MVTIIELFLKCKSCFTGAENVYGQPHSEILTLKLISHLHLLFDMPYFICLWSSNLSWNTFAFFFFFSSSYRIEAKLSLSTASPSVGGNAPELQTCKINLVHFENQRAKDSYYTYHVS